MKIRSCVVAASIIGSAVTFSGSPAHAVTTVETTVRNVSVVGDTCDATHVRVAGDWHKDAHNMVDVDVYGPRGRRVAGRTFIDELSGHASLRVNLCGDSDPAGTYQVEVVVNGYDENYDPLGTVYDAESFEFVKKPKVKSTVLRSVRYLPAEQPYPYLVLGTLLRAGKGWRGQRVELQARLSGGWTVIDRQKTWGKGRFGWQFKPNRLRWAYVYQGNRTTRWDASKVFRTPIRRNRVAATSGGDEVLSEVRQLIEPAH